jgi:hypothetical protein
MFIRGAGDLDALPYKRKAANVTHKRLGAFAATGRGFTIIPGAGLPITCTKYSMQWIALLEKWLCTLLRPFIVTRPGAVVVYLAIAFCRDFAC